MTYCYFNGETLPYGKCKLHISDLLIQRGYGIFDFFRWRNGGIPWFGDYIDRLYTSVELAGLEMGPGQEEFRSAVFSLKKKNRPETDAFKVIVTGGYSDNLDSVTGPANLVILNVPWRTPPPWHYENGVSLISCEYERPNPEIKTLNYFNALRLHHKFREFNAVDVLYHTENITEASRANVFFVKKGEVYTPASGILKGITRKQVLKLFSGIRVEDIPSEQLFGFDEIFITSTTRDITPVTSVDGKKIGNGKPGPVTGEILERFRSEEKVI